MNQKYILVIFLIIVLLIAGCVSESESNPKPENPKLVMIWKEDIGSVGGYGARIIKFADYEENVICYVYMDSERGGISCVQ